MSGLMLYGCDTFYIQKNLGDQQVLVKPKEPLVTTTVLCTPIPIPSQILQGTCGGRGAVIATYLFLAKCTTPKIKRYLNPT